MKPEIENRMEFTKNDHEHFIYFIRVTPTIPEFFYDISFYLSHRNLSFIPIMPNQIPKLSDNFDRFAIIVSRDINTYQSYKQIWQRYLKTYVLNKKIKLVHLSSFDVTDDLLSVKRKGTYIYYPLPLKIKHTCWEIAKMAKSEYENASRVWPGGRRAKLPSI